MLLGHAPWLLHGRGTGLEQIFNFWSRLKNRDNQSFPYRSKPAEEFLGIIPVLPKNTVEYCNIPRFPFLGLQYSFKISIFPGNYSILQYFPGFFLVWLYPQFWNHTV